ncbi:Transmembrane protein 252 [Lonchura striata]|uniref:Transmembrane protein 252 n=1 Tax=Lonchura striata TaxID=40157 RepID=A0A218V9N2_9PASE|nr:Transmembrane protein 252 [Lonchura striata domestica]
MLRIVRELAEKISFSLAKDYPAIQFFPLTLGLCLLFTGIFWSTFHEVLKYRALGIFMRNPSHREPHVCTIDRPDFYPPSYEDSIDPEKLVSTLSVGSTLKQQEFDNIPPPPYSESSAEFVSETNEQEQPPPYTLSLEQQQTAGQDPNPRSGLNSHIFMQEITCQQDTYFQRISQEEQHLSKQERQAANKILHLQSREEWKKTYVSDS